MEDLSITDDGEVYEYMYYLCRSCYFQTCKCRTVEELEDDLAAEEASVEPKFEKFF